VQSGWSVITTLRATQAGHLQCTRPFLAVRAVLNLSVRESPCHDMCNQRHKFISVDFGMVYLWRPQVQEPVTVVMVVIIG